MSKLRLLSFILVAGFMLYPAAAQDPHSPAASPDKALRQAISNSLGITAIWRDKENTLLVQIVISVVNAPADMAFDLSFQSGSEVWPVGPVAWRKGGNKWWVYDIDLPEEIKKVDVCFTPSRRAADEMARSDPSLVGDLKTIWTGAPIVCSAVTIVDTGVVMVEIGPRVQLSGHVDPLDEVDDSDPIIQQFERDGDRGKAFAQLQHKVSTHPQDATTLYNLGCFTVANGDLKGATKIFAGISALQPPETLRRKVQRLFLMICEMTLYHALVEHNADAMCGMGDAFENGYGVKQLPEVAKRWYREASNAGDADAMCHLAAMYNHEIGATVHTDEAHAWYRREAVRLYRDAAVLGNAEAKQWLASHDQH